MAQGRRRSFQGRAAPRRKRIWARSSNTLVQSGSTAVQDDLLSVFRITAGLAANPPGLTVGRVRLTVGVARTAGAIITSNFFMGVKVGNLSEDALDNDPALAGTGLHHDWMFWRKCFLAEDNAGGAVAALHANAWEFDIKAMRRMEEIGQTLWLVTGNINASDSFDISYGASTLLLMP